MDFNTWFRISEALLESKIELQARIIYGDATTMTSVTEPNNQNMGQSSISEQCNSWKTYDCYLFTWNLRIKGTAYHIWFLDYDPGTTITFTPSGGLNFGALPVANAFLPIGANFSATASFQYTNTSDIIGHMQVYNWSPTYSDYSENEHIWLDGSGAAKAVIQYNQ
ncbi:MAG: hypothetical protein JW801_17525 [Bacteroidales bacterium]|nr:hypothetical protein [Bacteroidales bacterium]